MSYIWELSDSARAALNPLPVDVQEKTLDELDRLAEDPSLLTARGITDSAVYDFLVPSSDGTHYIFLTARRDDPRRRLQVEAIGHYLRHES